MGEGTRDSVAGYYHSSLCVIIRNTKSTEDKTALKMAMSKKQGSVGKVADEQHTFQNPLPLLGPSLSSTEET